MHTLSVHCLHCRETVESTLADEPVHWVHDETGDIGCPQGGTVAAPDTRRLCDDAIAALDATYTLIYVDRDDTLTAQQIQVLLDGVNEYESDEFVRVEEWESEVRWQATQEIITEILGEDIRTLLDDADLLEEIRQVIYDRDDSDVITELIRSSDSTLFRFDLQVDVPNHIALDDPDDRRDGLAEIATAAGLDATDPAIIELLTELVADAFYGGHLYVIWYADPRSAIELADPFTNQDSESARTGTVVFHDTHLIIIDHLNGSGHEVKVDTITADWSPRQVSIDAPGTGPGYSWHDIAGPVASAYDGRYTLTRHTRTPQ